MQRQPDAGAPDAFAGGRLENRAMSGAHEITVVGAEELIVDKIEGDAGMGATINISEVSAVEVDQQRFELSPGALHDELLALAMLQFADRPDQFP